MKKVRWIYCFSILLLLSGLVANIASAAGTVQTTQDQTDKNKYYFVANFYYDIWKRSDGSWTSDGSPDTIKNMNWDYSYEFTGRKITNVDVRAFNPSDDLPVTKEGGLTGAEQVYKNSRYGQDWATAQGTVSRSYSTQISSVSGKGTSSVNFSVSATGLLSARISWEDITEEGGGNLADGVEGRRYYFPSLVTIQLEPEGGTAYVKYFTTTGQPLDGVDGFANYDKPLVQGQTYTFPPKADTANYKYAGWKKSTTGPPSGGTMMTGTPWALDPYEGGYDYYLNLYYDAGSPPPPPPPSGSCSESTGPSLESQVVDPGVSAVIKADSRGNEKFEVLDGIPTSESLYGNVNAKNYLYQSKFSQKQGKCTFNVNVKRSYTLKWDPGKKVTDKDGKTTTVPDPQETTEELNQSIKVERTFSYWVIDNLQVFKIDKSDLWNNAFASNGIEITPTGYTPPYYSFSQSGTYTPPDVPDEIEAPPGSLSGGTEKPSLSGEDLTSYAEQGVKKVKVNNDTLTFLGSTIMNGAQQEESTPTPSQIPAPTDIGQNVLYSPGNVIPNTKPNSKNLTSSGSINYGLMPSNIGGGADKSFPIYGINTVTVHTPVVDYAVIPDTNRPFDQRMEPDMSRVVLVLDRPFTLNFTESGQHLNIKGYGNNDYKKYTLLKRVIFPFGVYSADKSVYYPENTWINIPVGQESMTFQMPTWINEGNYHVITQSWAVNSQGIDGSQPNFNGNLQYYSASNEFDVGVVGRLFGFRIWDIGDFRFEDVFRTAVGSTNHSAAAYYSGGRDENGNITNMYGKNSWLLPIRPNSHPTQKATVPHNGYSFLFDFKTIGNLWNVGEGVRIDPTFWFVPKAGGAAKQVDLYYDVSGSTNKMIKVGSSTDQNTYSRVYQLADKMRNISDLELSMAAQYEYNYILSPAQRSLVPWTKFLNQYKDRKSTIGAGYENELLSYQDRTLIGPTAIPSGVDSTVALRSVQHWYGEYNLPIAPYILPKGTNILDLSNKYGKKLTGREGEFLKNGYIMVHFEIYTVKNNNSTKNVLGYNAPLADMWAIEGEVASSQDYLGHAFTYKPGDIAMFESDFSVRNDYQAQSR